MSNEENVSKVAQGYIKNKQGHYMTAFWKKNDGSHEFTFAPNDLVGVLVSKDIYDMLLEINKDLVWQEAS